MIRYQYRRETYVYSAQKQEVLERNTTVVSAMVPVAFKRTQDDHFLAGSDVQVTGGARRVTDHDGVFASQLKREDTKPQDAGKLPLLCIDWQAQKDVRTDALAEAAKSAVVTSTTGAVVGFVAWGLFGPVGAGVMMWAGAGAGAVGAVAGAAQFAEASSSNSMREFAQECNEFLECANLYGIDERCIAMYRECERLANTTDKRNLLAEIYGACEDHFGESAKVLSLHPAPARVATPEPEPEVPSEAEAQPRTKKESWFWGGRSSGESYEAQMHRINRASMMPAGGFGGR